MRRRTSWYRSSIARRPWRESERRVVRRGFWGRFFIAVEPVTISVFFAVLAVGLVVQQRSGAMFVAPIFAVASVLFAVYATVLMFSVTRAVIETFGSIWIVDGYVRYRMQLVPFQDPAYYVAVLDERQEVLGEWLLDRRPDALDRAEPWPAHVEFTEIGGVLRIDGRSTGVLPDDIPALGIGAPAAFAQRSADDDVR
jgi:hypothetical protein